jgi:hypothetical protein
MKLWFFDTGLPTKYNHNLDASCPEKAGVAPVENSGALHAEEETGAITDAAVLDSAAKVYDSDATAYDSDATVLDSGSNATVLDSDEFVPLSAEEVVHVTPAAEKVIVGVLKLPAIALQYHLKPNGRLKSFIDEYPSFCSSYGSVCMIPTFYEGKPAVGFALAADNERFGWLPTQYVNAIHNALLDNEIQFECCGIHYSKGPTYVQIGVHIFTHTKVEEVRRLVRITNVLLGRKL